MVMTYRLEEKLFISVQRVVSEILKYPTAATIFHDPKYKVIKFSIKDENIFFPSASNCALKKSRLELKLRNEKKEKRIFK